MKKKLFLFGAIASAFALALTSFLSSSSNGEPVLAWGNRSFVFNGSTPIKSSTLTATSLTIPLQRQSVNAALGTYILFEGEAGGSNDQVTTLNNSSYLIRCQRVSSGSIAFLVLLFYVQGLTSVNYVTSGVAGDSPIWEMSLKKDGGKTTLKSVTSPGSGLLVVPSLSSDELEIYIAGYTEFQITSLAFNYHC